jgi:ubiquinone/menaquinone biosynthesis C-methylase UbiE
MKELSMSAFPHQSELERIRAEYSRRGREIPSDYYQWNRPVNLYFQCQLMRDIISFLDQHGMFPLNGRSIADIGCGSGAWLLEFAQWGAECAHLAGVDLDENRIKTARASLPAADLHAGSATTLAWPNASLDLVSQFTLFSSILSTDMRKAVAAEMLRVLKPGGAVLWYDLAYDNPRNPNVKGIGSAQVQSLFPECDLSTRRVTLAPPVARISVPVSWILSSALEKLPFLRTHHLHLIRKRTA